LSATSAAEIALASKRAGKATLAIANVSSNRCLFMLSPHVCCATSVAMKGGMNFSESRIVAGVLKAAQHPPVH
jgi:hypothetical protein